MFQNLRTNSQIYILHKGGIPAIDVATVTDVAKPNPYSVPMIQAIGSKIEDTLSVTVKIGTQETTFPGLPYTADTMDYPSKGMFITTSRDALNIELNNIKNRSQEAINSVDFQKEVISACDKLPKEMNPEYAERQDLKDEVNALKEQMTQLLNLMSGLKSESGSAN